MTTLKLPDLAILFLILAIIYCIGATTWIICLQVLIRWVDYFEITIEDKPLEPLVSVQQKKQIEIEKDT